MKRNIFVPLSVVGGIALAAVQTHLKMKAQPDINFFGGQWIVNPMKHFTPEREKELLTKVDELNKKFGCD